MAKQGVDSVVPLRNEKAVVPAAEYIDGQLNALLELEMVSGELKPLVEIMVAMVRSICYGQSETTLIKNFDTLVATLSAAQAALSPDSVESSASLQAIDTELKRREKLREQAAKISEVLLNERDQTNDKLSTITALVKSKLADDATLADKTKLEKKLASLKTTIDTIVAAIGDNDRKVSQLTSYRAAVLLVEKGLPAGIIGEKIELSS